jgi:TRAP-type C4-dicarboxylate transport system permease small subunit
MDLYIRTVRMVSQLCGYLAAALIALSVIVVCEMVFVRFVLNENTVWQTDFVTYSLVAATFVGSPFVLMTRGHVNVDVLPQYLRGRKRFGLALVSTLLSMAFCLVMFVLTSLYWREAWTQNWLSNTIWRARLWIPYAALPVGMGLLTLQYFAELYNLVTGREPPFGIKDGERPL